MLETPDLFHTDPRKRWDVARKLHLEQADDVAARIAEYYSAWPKYWWGVINPWLVFIGPSPGNSGARTIDWAREGLPTLGQPQVHFKEYNDSVGFWVRMREWTANAFELAGIFPGEPEAALGSVLLANLVPTNQGDSRKIGRAELESAIPAATLLLTKLRPRVIVPMDKRISQLLVDELKRLGSCIESGPVEHAVPAKSQTYPFYKPRSWRVTTPFGALRIAESPQHPSRRNFYEPRELDRYLGDVLTDAVVEG